MPESLLYVSQVSAIIRVQLQSRSLKTMHTLQADSNQLQQPPAYLSGYGSSVPFVDQHPCVGRVERNCDPNTDMLEAIQEWVSAS